MVYGTVSCAKYLKRSLTQVLGIAFLNIEHDLIIHSLTGSLVVLAMPKGSALQVKVTGTTLKVNGEIYS